jgi:hypothetical protein
LAGFFDAFTGFEVVSIEFQRLFIKLYTGAFHMPIECLPGSGTKAMIKKDDHSKRVFFIIIAKR